MKNTARLFTCLCLAVGLQLANAATVEVDTISGGVVDPSVLVTSGDFFTVDVVVESVVDLAGHDITLGFDTSVLSAVSLTSGLFYGGVDDPGCLFVVVPGTCTLASDIGPGGALSEADIATDIFGETGSGILFSILFEAVGVGVSALSLDFVDLSDSLGASIIPAGTFDGTVTVAGASAVPLPGAVWLFATGLIGLLGSGRYRHKRQ